jgi:zinc transporter
MNSEALIHAILFDGTGGGKRLSWQEVLDWKASMGVLWLHFVLTEPGVEDWIRNDSGLSPMVADALMAQETRPRTHVFGDGVLLALRGINLNPNADPEDMVSIRIWADSTRVITSQRRALQSVQDIADQLEQKRGPRGSAEFIVNLTNQIVWRMGDTLEGVEERIDYLEDLVLAEAAATLRLDLANLRRQTISLRRYLSPQKEALNRLIVEQISWLDETQRLRLREIGDRLIRYIENLDEVRDRAAVTQEELMSRVSEQLNSRMYVLSVVAAVFMPLGFFTGLLGINVGGIPGVDNPHAFFIFMAILMIISVLQVTLFKVKKWF